MRYQVNIPAKLAPAAAGAQVYVYMPGTTIPVPFTIYADGNSAATLANPYSHPGGNVSFCIPVPLKVDIGVKPAGAAAPAITPNTTPAQKAFSYATWKSGGRLTTGNSPSGWVLT